MAGTSRIFFKVILISKQPSKIKFWTSKPIFQLFDLSKLDLNAPIHQKGPAQLDLNASKNLGSWTCWKQPILRTSHPGSHLIKPVNWTPILAATLSNQATGQPSWQPLNQTRQLNSHPGSHSIKSASESWRPVGRLEGGVWGRQPPRKYQMTAAVSQQLWTSDGALVQRAQEPNIPLGNPSLRSSRKINRF